MNRSLPLHAAAAALLAALAACGGGGDAAVDTPTDSASAPDVQPAAVSTSERMAAAAATAGSGSNECAPIRPFYWEIGDRSGRLASGAVAAPGGATPTPGAGTPMAIASASKWVYGAYVAERRGGTLSADDRRHLQMSAGYNGFTSCQPGQTVAACQAWGTNGVHTPAEDGRFDYGGGHMQKHAVLMGLGSMTPPQLTAEVKARLGTEIAMQVGVQLAGGVSTSAEQYAKLLRKMIGGQLRIGALLGSDPVCTNPLTCAGAIHAPLPPNESWHYSLGHWVEDDPKVGDGAFSSPGAMGFYPWIDASRQFYGVVARQAPNGALGSVWCGRRIRKAWLSGVAQ